MQNVQALKHRVDTDKRNSNEASNSGTSCVPTLPHDMIGTAVSPLRRNQRLSDAAKTPEQLIQTNGSVLEIAGTDIDGMGAEQRYRIWSKSTLITLYYRPVKI